MYNITVTSCRFLNLLETEIYGTSSPIWREDFASATAGEVMNVASPAGSSIAPSPSMGPGSVGPSSVGPASVGRGLLLCNILTNSTVSKYSFTVQKQ